MASKRALIRETDVFAMITSTVKSSSQRDGYLRLDISKARKPIPVEYSGEAEDSRGKNR